VPGIQEEVGSTYRDSAAQEHLQGHLDGHKMYKWVPQSPRPASTDPLQDFLCIRKNYSMYNFINISEFKSLAAGENAGLTMRTDPEG
jgi:hypothetical protein